MPAPLAAAAAYAAFLLVMNAVLVVLVIRGRFRSGVVLGDGGDKELGRLVRIHGNFAEAAPLGLAALALLCLLRAPEWAIHLVGAPLVLGRLAHAQGLMGRAGTSPGRAAGTVLTQLSLLLAAGVLLWLAFGGPRALPS